MGAEGAEEDEGAAIYKLLDGYDTMGIGYMAYEASEQNVGLGKWVIPLRLLRLLEHLRC